MRADVHRGPNDVNHRKLARALAARSTSEAVGPERRQRPSSDLRRSPAPAKDRPSRATRLLASESTPRGDILALQPVHRSRWTACRRGSAAPPTMVLEENIRVSGVSLPALPGGLGSWRGDGLASARVEAPRGARAPPTSHALNRPAKWRFRPDATLLVRKRIPLVAKAPLVLPNRVHISPLRTMLDSRRRGRMRIAYRWPSSERGRSAVVPL